MKTTAVEKVKGFFKAHWKKLLVAALIIGIFIGVLIYLRRRKKAAELVTSTQTGTGTGTGTTSGSGTGSTGTSSGGSGTPETFSNNEFASLPKGKLPVKRGDAANQLAYMLQFALNTLYGESLELDGKFGPATESALLKHTGQKTLTANLAQQLYNEFGVWKQQQNNASLDPILAQFQKLI